MGIKRLFFDRSTEFEILCLNYKFIHVVKIFKGLFDFFFYIQFFNGRFNTSRFKAFYNRTQKIYK